MAAVCPVCGRLLRNERHLHAEDPGTIHGQVALPTEIIVDENTTEYHVKTVLDYDDWREDAGA